MLKKTLLVAAMITLPAQVALAQGSQNFIQPCERGPFPRVEIINSHKADFVTYLTERHPTMDRTTALSIAQRLCADMSLVGDSAGLSRRLQTLLRNAGY